MQIKPGDSNEKVEEMVKRLQEYDTKSETLTIEEVRELIKRSGMIIFLGWEDNSSFFLDQMRRQEKTISFEDVDQHGELRGSGYNIDAQTMATWSLAPENEELTLMEIIGSPYGNLIFWNVHSTSSDQIYGPLTSTSLLGKNKIDVLKEQLCTTYERYVDTRRQYEVETKKTYVLEQRNLQLENEVKTWKNIARIAVEVEDTGIQIDDYASGLGDTSGQPIITDKEEIESSKEIEIRIMQNLLIHKIGSLKHSSQTIHRSYIALHGVEYQCSEAISLLSPLFTTWGPYT